MNEKMHVAYEFNKVSSPNFHIESITAYDDNVILGTRTGQLIMYTVEKTKIKDMPMFSKHFSKKPITQMEVVPEENLLFVLTDGMIQVCDISQTANNFALIHNAVSTKGCSLFALDVKILKTPKSTTGKTSTLIRVICVIRRRLQLYYWKPDVLTLVRSDIELKDVPKAISLQDDVICIGFKDEYLIYDISNPKAEIHQLLATPNSQSIEACICSLKNNSMLGIVKDLHLIPINPKEFIKRKCAKTQTTGSFDINEMESKQNLEPIEWSKPLLNLVWDDPYVIGRVVDGFEVRTLERCGINKSTIVQTIPDLAKIKFLVRSSQGIIFAAAISELWCLRAVDIPTQREQLLQQKKFQLAIDLTNTSNEPDEIKAETIRILHMNYAHVLFREKKFTAAMKEFAIAPAEPFDVIRLYPNLVQEQVKSGDANSFSGGIVPTSAMVQLEGKDLETAIEALKLYLTEARNKIIKVEKKPTTSLSSKQKISIIDTTLLKCYMMVTGPTLSLIKMNQCHFEESKKILKKYNKIPELVALYQVNVKHKDALQLLKAQIEVEENANYDPIINYLQTMGISHLQLVFEFADWVLTKDPKKGLWIFTDEGLNEVENWPRAKVLDFLIRNNHKELIIPYLEHVINVWGDSNTNMHNVLVKQYREKVQQLVNELQIDNDAKENQEEKQAELQKYRTKLYDLLKNSEKYSPDMVLQDFPTNMLLEERALILGRLRKHEKVLALYVQILGDIEKACSYCEEHYTNDQDIFITLLKTILYPLKQPPYEGVEFHKDFLQPNQEIVLDIINKYAVKIDPMKLFTILPNDMLLHRLSSYLDTVLRTKMAEQHHSQILHGLLQAEIQRTKQLIKNHTNQFVELTESSVCSECKKRFINQNAFVRYPNGDIVHLSCHDKKISN